MSKMDLSVLKAQVTKEIGNGIFTYNLNHNDNLDKRKELARILLETFETINEDTDMYAKGIDTIIKTVPIISNVPLNEFEYEVSLDIIDSPSEEMLLVIKECEKWIKEVSDELHKLSEMSSKDLEKINKKVKTKDELLKELKEREEKRKAKQELDEKKAKLEAELKAIQEQQELTQEEVIATEE